MGMPQTNPEEWRRKVQAGYERVASGQQQVAGVSQEEAQKQATATQQPQTMQTLQAQGVAVNLTNEQLAQQYGLATGASITPQQAAQLAAEGKLQRTPQLAATITTEGKNIQTPPVVRQTIYSTRSYGAEAGTEKKPVEVATKKEQAQVFVTMAGGQPINIAQPNKEFIQASASKSTTTTAPEIVIGYTGQPSSKETVFDVLGFKWEIEKPATGGSAEFPEAAFFALPIAKAVSPVAGRLNLGIGKALRQPDVQVFVQPRAQIGDKQLFSVQGVKTVKPVIGEPVQIYSKGQGFIGPPEQPALVTKEGGLFFEDIAATGRITSQTFVVKGGMKQKPLGKFVGALEEQPLVVQTSKPYNFKYPKEAPPKLPKETQKIVIGKPQTSTIEVGKPEELPPIVRVEGKKITVTPSRTRTKAVELPSLTETRVGKPTQIGITAERSRFVTREVGKEAKPEAGELFVIGERKPVVEKPPSPFLEKPTAGKKTPLKFQEAPKSFEPAPVEAPSGRAITKQEVKTLSQEELVKYGGTGARGRMEEAYGEYVRSEFALGGMPKIGVFPRISVMPAQRQREQNIIGIAQPPRQPQKEIVGPPSSIEWIKQPPPIPVEKPKQGMDVIITEWFNPPPPPVIDKGVTAPPLPIIPFSFAPSIPILGGILGGGSGTASLKGKGKKLKAKGKLRDYLTIELTRLSPFRRRKK